MHRQVHRNDVWPCGLQPLDALGTSVGRPVVHDPKHPFGTTVGLLLHDLVDEATKCHDPGFIFAPSEDLCSPHIPRRQIVQRPAPLISMFHSHGPRSSQSNGWMFADSGLYAGFFVRADHMLIGTQKPAAPYSVIEVQYASRFAREMWIAGEYPTPILPRPDGVFAEPPPHGGIADLGRDSPGHGLASNLGCAEPGQWDPPFTGKLTCQSLHLHDYVRGENRADALVVAGLPVPQVVPRKSVSAIYLRPAEASRVVGLSRHCRFPGLQEGRLWPGQPYNTMTYNFEPLIRVSLIHSRTERSDTGSFSAYSPPLGGNYTMINSLLSKNNTSSYL